MQGYLAPLDNNGDGRLTGDELWGLAVWHDANGNGICDAGEVRALASWGIVALSCRYQIDAAHPDKIAFSPQGVTLADGTTQPTFDAVLHPKPGAPAPGPQASPAFACCALWLRPLKE